MTAKSKVTFSIEPKLRNALLIRSAATSRSMSDLINDAVRAVFAEDAEDLAAFDARKSEPTVSYEDFVRDLKQKMKLRRLTSQKAKCG